MQEARPGTSTGSSIQSALKVPLTRMLLDLKSATLNCIIPEARAFLSLLSNLITTILDHRIKVGSSVLILLSLQLAQYQRDLMGREPNLQSIRIAPPIQSVNLTPDALLFFAGGCLG